MATPTAADLAAIPLFESLSTAELQETAQLFTVRLYPKDAVIATEGDRLDLFNVILSGRIQWFWSDEAGRQLKLQPEGLGGHFADTTLGGEPILMSIVALEPVRVASIPMAELKRLLLRHPQLAVSLLMDVVARLRRVGYPPGGESDIVARLVVDRMRSSLGAPVIVENKPGAGGMLAAEALKNAIPDGRTLMVSPIAVTIFAPLTHSKLRYDPIKDFAPVSLAAYFQMAFAVGPGVPAKTLHEYIAWARANPAKATYGVPLAGGPTHFFGVMLARTTGVDLAVVPYKGSAPFVNDLLGGQVPAGITVLSQLLQHHEAGKLRVLGTSGSQRSPMAPDVPTFKELGFAAIEGTGWQAFHTRAGTPRPTIDRLSTAIASAIKSPEIGARLLALGLEPVGSTPDELASRVAEDAARWAPIVKASGFRADE